jgi:predicted acetyltransferase
VAAEYLSANRVEFTCRCARTDSGHHRLAGLRDDPTCTDQSVEFALVVDGHPRESTDGGVPSHGDPGRSSSGPSWHFPFIGRARALLVLSGQDGKMKIEVSRAIDDDRPIVRRLLQLYRYDFSEFDGSDVDRHGEYLHRYFDEYWLEGNRVAFLIRVDGALAGFALLYTGDPHDVAEFFVMRKYRRMGVGQHAATLLFKRFPGRWTVRQQVTNRPAIAFWREAIGVPFEEVERNGEVVQSFIVGSEPGRSEDVP